jgi:hypothetical protein
MLRGVGFSSELLRTNQAALAGLPSGGAAAAAAAAAAASTAPSSAHGNNNNNTLGATNASSPALSGPHGSVASVASLISLGSGGGLGSPVFTAHHQKAPSDPKQLTINLAGINNHHGNDSDRSSASGTGGTGSTPAGSGGGALGHSTNHASGEISPLPLISVTHSVGMGDGPVPSDSPLGIGIAGLGTSTPGIGTPHGHPSSSSSGGGNGNTGATVGSVHPTTGGGGITRGGRLFATRFPPATPSVSSMAMSESSLNIAPSPPMGGLGTPAHNSGGNQTTINNHGVAPLRLPLTTLPLPPGSPVPTTGGGIGTSSNTNNGQISNSSSPSPSSSSTPLAPINTTPQIGPTTLTAKVSSAGSPGPGITPALPLGFKLNLPLRIGAPSASLSSTPVNAIAPLPIPSLAVNTIPRH